MSKNWLSVARQSEKDQSSGALVIDSEVRNIAFKDFRYICSNLHAILLYAKVAVLSNNH